MSSSYWNEEDDEPVTICHGLEGVMKNEND